MENINNLLFKLLTWLQISKCHSYLIILLATEIFPHEKFMKHHEKVTFHGMVPMKLNHIINEILLNECYENTMK